MINNKGRLTKEQKQERLKQKSIMNFFGINKKDDAEILAQIEHIQRLEAQMIHASKLSISLKKEIKIRKAAVAFLKESNHKSADFLAGMSYTLSYLK